VQLYPNFYINFFLFFEENVLIIITSFRNNIEFCFIFKALLIYLNNILLTSDIIINSKTMTILK